MSSEKDKVESSVASDGSPESTGLFVTYCQRVHEELVVSGDGVVPVRVLQDARVVCSRILSTDELNKLGLVQAGPWGPLAAENGSMRCIEEFEQRRSVLRVNCR